MSRKKKVTIHVLKSDKEDGANVRVTFNQRTIKYVEYGVRSDALHDVGYVNFYKSKLEKILRYEYSLIGEEYKMKGVTRRMQIYRMPILGEMNTSLKREILPNFGDLLTYNQYQEVDSYTEWSKDGASYTSHLYAKAGYSLFKISDLLKANVKEYLSEEIIEKIKIYNLFLTVDQIEKNKVLTSREYNSDNHRMGSKGIIEFIDWLYEEDFKIKVKEVLNSKKDYEVNDYGFRSYLNENFSFFDLKAATVFSYIDKIVSIKSRLKDLEMLYSLRER